MGLVDVDPVGVEHVEGERPAGLEPVVERPQHRQPLAVVTQVQERPEGHEHHREAAKVGQVAHIGLDEPQVEPVGRRPLAGQVEHDRRGVDTDDRDARERDGHGDPARADADLEHRAPAGDGLLDVERDVLGDRPAPGVVAPAEAVVRRGH